MQWWILEGASSFVDFVSLRPKKGHSLLLSIFIAFFYKTLPVENPEYAQTVLILSSAQ